MAIPRNQFYDPYTDQNMTQLEYMQEMLRRQQHNQYNQAMGSSEMQRAQPIQKPIPQPEPFLNPVLLLLE